MRYVFRAVFLAIVLSGCSGGSGGAPRTLPPTDAQSTAQGQERSAEAITATWVYVAHDADIAVYPAGARGTVQPARVISGPATLLSRVQGISVDRFGRLFVAVKTGGITVLVFAPGARGNVAPERVLHAGDPPDHMDSYAAAVAVRYDDTVAVAVGTFSSIRDIHVYNRQFLGLFDATGTFTQEFPDEFGVPRSVTVDGSGDVLSSVFPALYAIRPAFGTEIRRLSPHPDGYYNDGLVYKDDLGATGAAIAASGDDDLQRGALRMNGSLANPIAPVVALGGGIGDGSSLAFDAQGRLYAISTAPGDTGDVILVYAHTVYGGQLPSRTLRGQSGAPAVGITVGP